MVMAHSLVQVLHQNREAVVDLLAPPATAPLGERMPGVSETFVLDVGHGQLGLSERRRMAALLKPRDYDRAIVLPNSFKSALVPFWAAIPTRTGWTGESRYLVLNDRRRLDRERLPLMVERFVALAGAEDAPAAACPAPQLEADEARLEALRTSFGLTAEPATVLCPGAEFGPAKRWRVRSGQTLAGPPLRRGGECGDGPGPPGLAAGVARRRGGV
jgi:heptosyltransferase-2